MSYRYIPILNTYTYRYMCNSIFIYRLNRTRFSKNLNLGAHSYNLDFLVLLGIRNEIFKVPSKSGDRYFFYKQKTIFCFNKFYSLFRKFGSNGARLTSRDLGTFFFRKIWTISNKKPLWHFIQKCDPTLAKNNQSYVWRITRNL